VFIGVFSFLSTLLNVTVFVVFLSLLNGVGIIINIYRSCHALSLLKGFLGLTYIVSTCVMDLKRFAITGFKQIDSGYKELVPNGCNPFGEGHTDVQEVSIFTLEFQSFYYK
jgi:hypothetical protein